MKFYYKLVEKGETDGGEWFGCVIEKGDFRSLKPHLNTPRKWAEQKSKECFDCFGYKTTLVPFKFAKRHKGIKWNPSKKYMKLMDEIS